MMDSEGVCADTAVHERAEYCAYGRDSSTYLRRLIDHDDRIRDRSKLGKYLNEFVPVHVGWNTTDEHFCQRLFGRDAAAALVVSVFLLVLRGGGSARSIMNRRRSNAAGLGSFDVDHLVIDFVTASVHDEIHR